MEEWQEATKDWVSGQDPKPRPSRTSTYKEIEMPEVGKGEEKGLTFVGRSPSWKLRNSALSQLETRSSSQPFMASRLHQKSELSPPYISSPPKRPLCGIFAYGDETCERCRPPHLRPPSHSPLSASYHNVPAEVPGCRWICSGLRGRD